MTNGATTTNGNITATTSNKIYNDSNMTQIDDVDSSSTPTSTFVTLTSTTLQPYPLQYQ
ncbi:10475_t:CDS:2 [Entrophospora sp. SA101]|nr:10475_t:CDS:2 [Entrophospora sp. SA101]